MRFLILIFLLLCPSLSFASKKIFAVLEFTGEGIPQQSLRVITDASRGGALDMLPPDKYQLMTRENTRLILDDMGIDMSCVAGQCEVETLRNLRADYGLTGTVVKIEGSYHITLQIYDTVSSALLSQSDVVDTNLEKLLQKTKQETKILLATSVPDTGMEEVYSVGKVVRTREFDRGENIVNVETDKSGFFTVDTEPTGAEVYINGDLVGNAPVQVERNIGKYVITAEYGTLYHNGRWEGDLGENETAEINLELKPAFGMLVVQSEPSGADVYLSGKNIGRTPQTIERQPSGIYNLTLENPNYISIQKRIVVEDEQKLVIKETIANIYQIRHVIL